MASEILFKHETIQDMDTLMTYLDAVREGLKSGKLRLADKSDELELAPRGLVAFDIEAKGKGDRRKLTLKFTWKEVDDPNINEESLVITGG